MNELFQRGWGVFVTLVEIAKGWGVISSPQKWKIQGGGGPGGGYSHILPIRVCAAQRGRDFEVPDLERGIHFRGVF